MHASFRQSMNWLHTWAGVMLGGLLFAIFWMGTLSVFDREIDRWMMPMTRLEAPAAPMSLDALRPQVEAVAKGARQWGVSLPTERVPTAQLFWRDGEGFKRRHADPATGALLPEPGTLAGTGFIFPFHFNLHITWERVGYWIVGLAGMAMLALLVSGVIIHIRIFKDFFTLRTGRKAQRTVLDLHNVAGVLGLPFHFVITLSGLIIFFSIYFPVGWQPVFQGDRAAFNREAFGSFSRPAAGTPAPAASLDAMVAEATRRWDGAPPYFVRVWHPGDAASYVELRRSFADGIPMNLDQIFFDGPTGGVLHTHTATPVMQVQQVVSGLHFIQFRHWTLRFVYFGLGLTGCMLIATGFLFWLESRRKRHIALGLHGVRIVEGLAIGSVTGIILATAAFFVANRILPLGLSGRAGWEMTVFYAVWAAGFAYGWWRPRAAWREQSWAIGATALAAVLLNAVTTGDHPLQAAARGQWGVAGVDAGLLLAAAIAVATARSLGRPQPAIAQRAPVAAE